MTRTVDIVIACKGRLHHLKQTLPGFLDQDVPEYGVIVVDYGCPDDAFDYIRELNHPRLRCIKVKDGTELFSLPRAINIGVNFSAADIIAKVDADQLVRPDWLRSQIEAIGEAGIARPATFGEPVADGDIYQYPSPLGSARENTYPGYCMTREAFHAVRGIDEGFVGWGYEDADLCFRVLHHAGLTDAPFVPYRGAFLNHSEDESVRFYAEKNKATSAEKNLARLHQYGRQINPSGYGQTRDYELWNLPDRGSAAGAWDEYYSTISGQLSYGTEESYFIPGVWLGGLNEVEDWGCGLGFAKRFLPHTRYIGIDGSPNPHVDVVTDLRFYRSAAEGILLRHVLDHNWCWEQILSNAIASFRRQMAIVIWLPMVQGEAVHDATNFLGTPDLRIPADRLEAMLAGLWWRKHECESGETVYLVRKP